MTMTADERVGARQADPTAVATEWLEALSARLRDGDDSALAELFVETATGRDFLAFTWDVTNRIGRDDLVPWLREIARSANARDFRISPVQQPRAVDGGVQVFFDFVTDERSNAGYALLAPHGEGFACSTLQTQANGLIDHPERTLERRPDGKVHGYVPGRTRWGHDRQKQQEFVDADPAVVILGAGQNGLAIAARLHALDVPTLVVDREERVGDTWRKRYASLALHSLLHVDHLPYLPFPPTWTAHTPKDKFADFLEAYANLLDLNVWVGTDFVDADFDSDEERWTINVRRPDGSVRTLRPRHFVVAAGLNGTPRIPDVPGLDQFTGTWAHTGEYQGGADHSGEKVLVVGAGVSAHEIAHDLHEHGAEVTMLQRSATYVINFDTYNDLWFGLYSDRQDLPLDIADQVAYSIPNRAAADLQRMLVQLAKERDRDLLAALEARGFQLEWGPDGTGIIGSHMAGRDSYQINIGASELVADGSIGLKQGVELVEIDGSNAVFSDGSRESYDAILFATGYEPLWETIRDSLGASVADIGKVYGQADDGEYANVWRRSAKPGLWFGTGFVGMARFHSRPVALLIKAIEEGIIPMDSRSGV